MVEFLRKFENRGIKIPRVNSILITKPINLQFFTVILYGVWGFLCDDDIFKLTASALSNNREIYVIVRRPNFDPFLPYK